MNKESSTDKIGCVAGGAEQSGPCMASIGSRVSHAAVSRVCTTTSQFAGRHGVGDVGWPVNGSVNVVSLGDSWFETLEVAPLVPSGTVTPAATRARTTPNAAAIRFLTGPSRFSRPAADHAT